ncbi:prephenate dehydrogenase [Paracoccus caeni]|uniref:Prephenate dehydrogenase n=1 Tax=Paracoccus caeni TaxID=657651 RepID=A0A934SGK4_9RHOB|nr:prephenate dehydrogenase [Paracoccus caeni]MBK4214804.1 prephenate dehydrogenase [Paracoccus caeni]
MSPKIAIIGFGAFGQLAARHLRKVAEVCICDPSIRSNDLKQVDLPKAARCATVILAVPLSRLEEVLHQIAPHLRPGALVIDTCSVKIRPARLMLDILPAHVDLLATHPLFGPQSAADGVSGHRIVWCPLRGRGHLRAAVRARRAGLRIIQATPEQHDRDMAVVQGLTHLIAQSLSRLGPMPERMATSSFGHLLRSVGMVHADSPELLRTILTENPFAADVRARFLQAASEIAA